jgi:regulator of cell morphogenesis and NO signaling
MNTLEVEGKTVGDLVRENPGCAAIFEELGIDFCCRGDEKLAEACRKKGLDDREVSRRLAAVSASETDVPECDAMTLTALADHIEETHHAYLRRQLPRLDQMAERVASVHGERDPHLSDLHHTLQELSAELASHMAKEEQILFPLIRAMEAGGLAGPSHCGSIANPITVMVMEHEDAGEALARMRDLTGGYRLPEHACNTYRVLYHELDALEKNLHIHIHKENQILFPKAMKLEKRVASGC